jgi:hypothetical protein
MADPYVRQARNVFTGTVGSTDMTAGDPVYFDGTDWELADADDNTKYAEAIAVNSCDSGEVGSFCTSGIIVDIDAPYTQGAAQFLSTTAGDITETRPTGANNLSQVLGFGLSTSEIRVEVQIPKETTINLVLIPDAAAAPKQNLDYTGVALEAANEAAGATFMVPQNCISASGVVAADLWWCSLAGGPALDSSDTYTIDVSAGIDDETVTATSDGITAAALTVASDDLASADVSAAFNTAGIIEPGNVVGVDIDKAAEGSAGDDPIMLCLAVVIRTV